MDSVVTGLRGRLLESLDRAIPEGAPVALLDFPSHANVGDSAIWSGERVALCELGHPVVSIAAQHYSPAAVRRAIGPEGVVLIHGGGNFGDLWKTHQSLRERVLRDFPDHAVVQLPQTVNFSTEEAAERFRRIVASRGQLTVLCRDATSVEIVETQLAPAEAAVCPDAAFALTMPRPGAPSRDVVLLARTDKERVGERLGLASIEAEDWLGDSGRVLGLEVGVLQQVAHRWGRVLARPRAHSHELRRPLATVYDRLAAQRVERGSRLLAQGRVVVTDRLHAHIFCLLMGIPHVVLDTGYGKLERFISAWTRDSELVHLARSAEDAGVAAERLLAARSVRPSGV